MAKLNIERGSLSTSIYLFIIDLTGQGRTGLVHNTRSIELLEAK